MRLSSSLSGGGDFPILNGHKAAQDLSKDTLKSQDITKEKEGMNKAKIKFELTTSLKKQFFQIISADFQQANTKKLRRSSRFIDGILTSLTLNHFFNLSSLIFPLVVPW